MNFLINPQFNDFSGHKRPTHHGRVRSIRFLIYAASLILLLATLSLAFGCGSGGGSGVCSVSPIVSGIVPAGARAGANVTINGNQFSGTNTISFSQGGTVKAQVTIPNGSIETTIALTIPASLAPGTYDVLVTDSDGCKGNSITYAVQ